MEWILGTVSVASVVGSLFFAAFNSWLTYKERKALQRGIIYQKQIDAYSAYIVSLSRLVKKANEILPENGIEISARTRSRLQKETSKEMQLYNDEYAKWVLFFSSSFMQGIEEFHTLWRAFTLHPVSIDQHDQAYKYFHSLHPRDDLALALYQVIINAQKELGIEQLSDELQKLSGQLKEKPIEYRAIS
jgi:hypothetical protein